MNKKLLLAIALMTIFAVACNKATPQENGNVNENVPEEGNSVEEVSTDETGVGFELVGTSWKWVKTQMNDDSSVDAVDSDRFILNFADNNEVSTTTDCNNAFGRYEFDGSSLTVGPLAMTKMYCEGSQENEYVTALQEVSSWMRDGDTLYLELKMDSGAMEFSLVE